MNDDQRRVHSALVRVTHLRPETSIPARCLVRHGLDQKPGQHWGRHLHRRRCMRLQQRLPHRRQSHTLDRRDVQHRRELQEGQAGLYGALQLLALILVGGIPLVDRHDHSTARLEDVAGDVRILVAHTLSRVDQQQHHVGIGDCLQRLHDRKFLDRLEDLALAAQPCRVDQFELTSVALERHVDSVTRGARLVEGDEAFLAEPGVDQR